jgi:hypothetical protein
MPGLSDEAWQGQETLSIFLLREGPHANVARYQVLVLGPGETWLVSKLTMNVLLILNDCGKTNNTAKKKTFL